MSATGGINLSAMGTGALKFDLGTPEVAGADNDNDSDHLKITSGTLTLGQVDFSDFAFNELTGIAAGTYTLIDAASTMAATLGTATGSIPGFSATLNMDNTTTFDITLTLTATSTPGDFNGDTRVNLADYVSWRKNDGTNNGYAAFRENFSVGPASGNVLSSAGSAVPEPGTIALASLSCFAIVSIRKRLPRLRRETV